MEKETTKRKIREIQISYGNKRELKEQLQDNLLTYFLDSTSYSGFVDALDELTLDGMCEVIIKTIDEHEQ